MHCIYWTTTTTTNPPIIRPHIVLTDGRQQRQIKPYFDHIVCLLTDENNNTPTIKQTNHNTTIYCAYWWTTTKTNSNLLRPHIVFTDRRKQRQSNHNTTTYCVYWQTISTTNPTMIPVWPWIVLTYRRQKRQHPTIIRPHIVFTGGRQPRQIQPHYDHMLCLLTDDNDKPNHNATCCVHWRTTTTNPTIIRRHSVY